MRMFRSRNEWFVHELQCHRRQWVCQFCQHDPLPTVQAFSNHVATIHPAILAASKMEAMILQSEEPVTKIPSKACPFCNEWERDLRDSKQDSKILLLNDGKIFEPYGTTKQFRKHLGRHMEQMALFALPVQESNELEDESVDEQEENDTDPDDQEDLLKVDITPPKMMDEAARLRKLTTYRVFTIQKAPPFDPKKVKATWAKAEVNEERLEQVDIVKQVNKLNESQSWTVKDRKAALAPFQIGQINRLLDEQASQECDRNLSGRWPNLTPRQGQSVRKQGGRSMRPLP